VSSDDVSRSKPLPIGLFQLPLDADIIRSAADAPLQLHNRSLVFGVE